MGFFPLVNDFYKVNPISQWGKILVTLMGFTVDMPSDYIRGTTLYYETTRGNNYLTVHSM